jgi:hypothetical protein
MRNSMLLESLKQSLIVSCQPVPGGAMDSEHIVTAFALAALAGAASALRIESVAYVAAVRKMTNAPIIGIVKRDLPDMPVRITPFVADAEALIAAGADSSLSMRQAVRARKASPISSPPYMQAAPWRWQIAHVLRMHARRLAWAPTASARRYLAILGLLFQTSQILPLLRRCAI